jgi:hypothetical protein
MSRPKAATPAAHIRGIVRFFETASIELADVAFELARAALVERKAKKKGEKPRTRAIIQALAVPDPPLRVQLIPPGAQTATAAHATPPAATTPAARQEPVRETPAQVTRPANKKRAQPKKRKPAGKKRGGPTTQVTPGDSLPEQHPVEEQAEPPDTVEAVSPDASADEITW